MFSFSANMQDKFNNTDLKLSKVPLKPKKLITELPGIKKLQSISHLMLGMPASMFSSWMKIWEKMTSLQKVGLMLITAECSMAKETISLTWIYLPRKEKNFSLEETSDSEQVLFDLDV